MEHLQSNFGVLDNRFLARSVGLLNPPPAVTIHQDEPVKEALIALQQNKIGCIVAVDDEDQIAGIFSERDVILKLVLTAINVNEIPLKDVMTTPVKTAQMTTTLAYTLHMMSQGGYRHMPVVDDEMFPVGMISIKNIVDYIASQLVKDLVEFDTAFE